MQMIGQSKERSFLIMIALKFFSIYSNNLDLMDTKLSVLKFRI